MFSRTMKDGKHGLAYTDLKPYGGLYKAMHENNRLASVHSASQNRMHHGRAAGQTDGPFHRQKETLEKFRQKFKE